MGVAVGNFLGSERQVVRGRFDRERQPLVDRPVDHREGFGRREMLNMHPTFVASAKPDHQGHRVEAMFIDSGFGAPYVERLQAMGFRKVHEVRFGGASLDEHQANMRAYMWGRCKEWLSNGAIDPDDHRLETDLTAPGYHINKKDQIVIESKEQMAKRGVASPDDGDALALTFAAPVFRGKKKARAVSVPAKFQWA